MRLRLFPFPPIHHHPVIQPSLGTKRSDQGAESGVRTVWRIISGLHSRGPPKPADSSKRTTTTTTTTTTTADVCTYSRG
ncbi:hypothetical protein P167DRAFT_367200 [Morchella conica CCBAS932]|uniref:Uncharacterized protein n=1 Tax=Morchella conica CCBAS932 TaxID=1392247 RepID=A0A3N4KI66_9PEZI|nr:hypothetical protein P167DRAFT_367200 [Morchella conica CCBAS932]